MTLPDHSLGFYVQLNIQSGYSSCVCHVVCIFGFFVMPVSICCELLLINSTPFLSPFLSILSPYPFTCLMIVLTFPLFISSTGATICGWPWPHYFVCQARTPVINIQSNIHRLKKDCQDHNYTTLQEGKGKHTQIPHPGSALGRWNKTKANCESELGCFCW